MTVDRTKTKPGHESHWYNRGLLPVYSSGQETGNKVLSMDHPMRELFISNDSISDDLTLTIKGDAFSLDFVLKPRETLNERFCEFTSITVTAAGDWRWYVRSGMVP